MRNPFDELINFGDQAFNDNWIYYGIAIAIGLFIYFIYKLVF